MKWTFDAIRGVIGAIDADLIGTASDAFGLFTDTGHTTRVSEDGQTVKAANALKIQTANWFTDAAGMTYQATGFTGSLPCLYSNASGKLTAGTNFPALANSQFAVYLSYSHNGTVNKVLWSAATATNTVYAMPRTSDYMMSMGTANGSSAFGQAVSVADTPEILAVRYDGEYFWLDFHRGANRRSAGGGQSLPRVAKTGSTGLSGVPLIVGAYTDGSLKPVIKIRQLIAVGRCPGMAEHADIIGLLAAATPAVNSPGVICCGDSITNSYDIGTTNPFTDSATYPYKLSALLTAAGVTNSVMRNAYSGRYLHQFFAEYDYDVRPHLWRQSGARNVVILFFGANDLTTLGGTALLATVREACNRVAIDGGIPIPCTLLNRGDNGAFDALRLAYNITLRNTYRQFAPALIDFGADSVMGPAAVVDDTTYFQTDKIHPKEAGNAELARIAYPVVKRALQGQCDIIDYTPGAVVLSTGTVRSGRRSR